MKLFSTTAVLLLFSFAAPAQPVFEPAGPSSRRTPIAISEIMFKPAGRLEGRNTEFVELYNSNPWPEDIGGYRLAGQIDYVVPAGTAIHGQGYLVVAANPADMKAVHGLETVLGPYTNSLKSSGELRLHDEQGSVLLKLDYDHRDPWPMGTEGTGHSLVLARASYGEADPRAWARSELVGGSPGAGDFVVTNSLRHVVINEVLARADAPMQDSIELYNHSNEAVDLSGCTLSDDPATNKFVVPEGVTIPARGFAVFIEDQLGFSLNGAGETVYFRDPSGTQVLDALRFEGQEIGVSFGRHPNGAHEWYRLGAATLGSDNAAPLVSQVGINEIMYRPIQGGDDRQYVELHNQGTNAVPLAGWKLGGGIDYTFPAGAMIAGNGYVVVGRDSDTLWAIYPQLNSANTFGNFSGRLSGNGERVTLSKPDVIVGAANTNRIDIVVDEVTYGTGGRWGRWSDGGGSSLELVDARSDKRLAANWADSDETAKAPWTTIEATADLTLIRNGSTPLQLGLLGPGECLVDDVEAPGFSGANGVVNGNFATAPSPSVFQGSHSRSSWETNSGFGGGGALRLRTADDVAYGPNSVALSLDSSFWTQDAATLRFKVRWLHGCPEPLLRFAGGQLEATGRMTVPDALGTPGLPNSRAVANPGPAIHLVQHDPPVPASKQPVVVTARVADPDGLATLNLRYRFDPSTARTNLSMNDFGVDGDAVAGDGIFSATLPGRQVVTTIGAQNSIAFVIEATDGNGATSRFPELVEDNAPDRECVVWFGEPSTNSVFGTYHLWLTKSSLDRWRSLPVMSNEEIDGTLVYNGRIIYNMGGRYSGSPFHQDYDSPAGNRACHYVWSMPKDDRLLGYSSFNKIHWPGNDIQSDSLNSNRNDATLQREQAANLFLRQLGVPWTNRRMVAVYVNGTRRGKLMEDACRPTGGWVGDEYFPDDPEGQLFKIQRWYGQGGWLEARLQSFRTPDGEPNAARYRPNWGLKRTTGSLSDFDGLDSMIEAANAYGQSNYPEIVEGVIDMENWMRVSAANHVVGNWDYFGISSGQNAAVWGGPKQRWTLFTIDLGICLDNSISGTGLFTFGDPVWNKMFTVPKFGRMYYRALGELADGVMKAEVINPILEKKHSAMTAAGIAAGAPTQTKSWIANRRNTVVAALTPVAGVDFALIAVVPTESSNTTTLSGIAPVAVVSIVVNGTQYEPRWTTLTNWSLTLPVPAGSHSWTVQAIGRNGQQVGEMLSLEVENPGIPEATVGTMVISEIMFNAATPDAEYVELFNRSTETSFDLSGWKVDGLGYTFPAGSVVAPQQHLVLARSSVVFAANYGVSTPVFGTFDGNLKREGETLTLVRPGQTSMDDLVVDRVRYETVAPWPDPPIGTALQLVDAAQDNSRVANWTLDPATKATPGATNSVRGTLPEFPPLWLNEVQVENLTGPTNASGQRAPWVELFNSGTNTLSLDGYYLGTNYEDAAQWAFPAGTSISPGQFLMVWLDGHPETTTSAELHAGFRLSPGGGSLVLARSYSGNTQIFDYLNFGSLAANRSYGALPNGQPFDRRGMYRPTPAGSNDAVAAPVNISINEWMAENTGFLLDAATGKFDDWFELHNLDGVPADLGGYYLTDSLDDPFRFRIPAGYVVPANGFLHVWADDKSSANGTDDPALHVPFKLSKDGEAIGLFAPDGTPIDAVVFGGQTANMSEGRYPDAGGLRLFMPEPSPVAPNILPPLSQPTTVSGFVEQLDGSFRLTLPTELGHTYRIEYKTELADPVWLPLGSDRFATTPSQVVIDTPGDTQRFYRVRLVQ